MDRKNFTIIIVDDEDEFRQTLSMIIESQGYSVLTSSNGHDALNQIKENDDIKLVLTDLKMPGMSGMELIKEIHAVNPSPEIIVVTAFGTIESAVDAMKVGASSYFVKSEDPFKLLTDINRIYEIHRLTRENEILKEQYSADEDFFLSTKNKKFRETLSICEKAADSSINVLILGESGVGKEIIAKYIHQNSSRNKNRFVPVNCQSFSDGTIESELFGHEKGAFTGALAKRIGRFEEANGGTIFLDEIGDLPLSTQGKLLRTLENHTIERVGSNKTINLDIRLLSATNKDIYSMVQKGDYREDLLYRINTLTITVPPLRERKEDLPDMIAFFIEKIQKEQKKKIMSVSPSTMDELLQYDYPGNVRELKNILERFVVLSEGHTITGSFKKSTISPSGVYDISGLSLRDARARFETSYITQALAVNNGNVSKTARCLDITDRQLWNKVNEYGIKIEK